MQRLSVTEFRFNTPMDTIGQRIRNMRRDLGISRKTLAKDVKIAYTTLSDLELGESKSTTALHRIAERLGVNANWLESGKGPREADTPGIQEEAAQYEQASPAELSAALALMAQALAESIPTAGGTLADALDRLPPELRNTAYLRGLRGTIRSQLAAQTAVRAPTPPKQGSGGRTRP